MTPIELFPGTLLRLGSAADIPALALLDASVITPSVDPWGEFGFGSLIDAGVEFAIVEMGGMPVGFVAYQHIGKGVRLKKFVMNAHGKQLGGVVLVALKNVWRDEGKEYVMGVCREEMVKYHERFGGVSVGRLPHYYGMGVDGYVVQEIL